MSRAITHWVAVAMAVQIGLAAASLGAAHYVAAQISASADRLARTETAKAAAETMREGAENLTLNALVAAGYETGPAPSTIDYASAEIARAAATFTAALPARARAADFTPILSAIDRARRSLHGRGEAQALAAVEDCARAQDALYDLVQDLTGEVASRRAEYAAAQRRVRYFDWMTAVPATLVLFGILLGTRWLSRALQRVTTAAAGIASNDFHSRVPVSGPREIATLGGAINAACDALDERDRWLQTALAQAQRQRDFLSSIIEATSDGLLLYDSPPDRVILFNRRALELIGLDERALTTRPAAELQQEVAARTVDPQGYHERLRRHLYAEGVHQDVLEIREPVPRVLRRTSSPLVFHDHTAGRVITYTDITAEATLERMKSEFVATASHELRTPLTSIHGALQLALAGSAERLDADDRELLQISLTSTERLVRLVNDLLDLSKMEAGRMAMRVVPHRAPDLVAQAIEAMRPMAGKAGVRLHAECEDAIVNVDADLLIRVLQNLISNAIKYSPAGTRVHLDARTNGERVLFTVDDEGPGIPADQLPFLFRPFSRVAGREYDRETGTGLGLAISRAIVEQHQGRIWAQALPEGGSRFAFELPAAAACAAVA